MTPTPSTRKLYLGLGSLALLTLSIFCYLIPPLNALVGDEVFYFFQAQALLLGELRWFSETSTLLWPLVLAPLSFSPLAGRALSISLGVLLILFFFSWVQTRESKKFALVATLVLLSHPQLLAIFTSLYSEGLALLLIVGLFYLVEQYLDKFKSGRETRLAALSIGALFGCLLLARFSAITLAVYPLARLLLNAGGLRDKFRGGLELVASLALGFCLLLLWLWYSGNNLFQIKTQGPDIGLIVQALEQLPSYFSTSLLVLGCLGLVLHPRAWASKVMLASLLAGLLTISSVHQLFPRYLFFLLLPLALTTAQLLQKLPRSLIGAALILQLYFSFTGWSYPGGGRWNRYFISFPGCKNIERVLGSCAPFNFRLPIFNQPNFSVCAYQFPAETLYANSFLYLAYVDDQGEVFVDGEFKGNFSAFNPGIVDLKAAPGLAEVVVTVSNSINIGGLGQVLLCDDPQATSLRAKLERSLESR